jgi:hypothetical protein
LIGSKIWIVGSLGYPDTRRYGETPVYALDTQTFQIERMTTSGSTPGWIQRHRTVLLGNELRISGGFIVSKAEDRELYEANQEVFILNTGTLQWRKEHVTQSI